MHSIARGKKIMSLAGLLLLLLLLLLLQCDTITQLRGYFTKFNYTQNCCTAQRRRLLSV